MSSQPDAHRSTARVDVWQSSSLLARPAMRLLAATLAVGEREHARRLHRATDRRAFIVGRGLLRIVLGAQLDVPGAQLEFVEGPWGKPALSGDGPHFNVSHSGDAVLIALSDAAPVGIDIEPVDRAIGDWHTLARAALSPAENRVLESLHAVDSVRARRAFFECWTLKEAYTKGRGEGLRRPFRSFDVSVGPGACARLVSDRHDPDAVKLWTLRRLDLGAGYAGALAVEHPDAVIRPRQVGMPPCKATSGLGAPAPRPGLASVLNYVSVGETPKARAEP